MEPRMVEEWEAKVEEGSRKAFLVAYAELQKELPRLGKDTRGHGYSYASLPDVLGKVRPVLYQHGFAIRFRTWSPTADSVGVRAILTHVQSGWYETSELIAAPEKCVGGRMNGIQARGAFITYAQRYTLLAVLGTTADVDTDAAGPPAEPGAPAPGEPIGDPVPF